MAQTSKNIAIIGSGLVGSLLAIYLRRIGHQVTVFDRRPDIRTIKFSGRSINLAMSNRGWRSLDEVGIGAKIKEIAIPLDKRAMHVNDKPVYFQKYGKDGEAIWSISRGVLNKKMIDLAEGEGAVFRFNEKVWDVNLPEAKIYPMQYQTLRPLPSSFGAKPRDCNFASMACNLGPSFHKTLWC